MSDNLWLLDLSQVFQGQKYIIILTPAGESESISNEALDAIRQGQKEMTLKMNKMQHKIMKAVNNVELYTRNLLK